MEGLDWLGLQSWAARLQWNVGDRWPACMNHHFDLLDPWGCFEASSSNCQVRFHYKNAANFLFLVDRQVILHQHCPTPFPAWQSSSTPNTTQILHNTPIILENSPLRSPNKLANPPIGRQDCRPRSPVPNASASASH